MAKDTSRQRGLMATAAVGATIRMAGWVRTSSLVKALSGLIDERTVNDILKVLVSVELIKIEGDLIQWVGPPLTQEVAPVQTVEVGDEVYNTSWLTVTEVVPDGHRILLMFGSWGESFAPTYYIPVRRGLSLERRVNG